MGAEYVHILNEGEILKDRYVIRRVLGQGGFGITYEGYDKVLAVQVAIKEYFPQGFVSRNTRYSEDVTVTQIEYGEAFQKGKEEFLEEARLMAQFNNTSGIVSVTDFFEMNNTAYIVMEYLDGITLKEFMNQYGLFAADEILHLMEPVMEALDIIHKKGMIHRDISPDNIMLLENNKVALMDFGAARDYTDFGEKSLSILLKRGYAPEEQYRSHGVQGPWTDVYALCATMYKCITGKTPPDAIERMVEDTLERPSEMGVDISPQMEEALFKGLKVFQKDRYQTIEELKRGMYQETASNPEPQQADEAAAAPVVPDEQKEKKPGLGKTALVSGAVCCLVLLMVVVIVLFPGKGGHDADEGAEALTEDNYANSGNSQEEITIQEPATESVEEPTEDTEQYTEEETQEQYSDTSGTWYAEDAVPYYDPDTQSTIYLYTLNDYMDISSCLATASYDILTSYDGSFSFGYPIYLFNKYDIYLQNDYYSLWYEDDYGEIRAMLNVYKGDCYYSDPLKNARAFHEEFSSGINEIKYDFMSEKIDKNGFARTIVYGPVDFYDYMNAKYTLVANNGQESYIFEFYFYDPDISSDYEEMDYILDCIYRFCSFSGSTYLPRTYDQFLKDDMGTKK